MNLKGVQKLLNDNGIHYVLSTEPNKADFYRRKGYFSRAHSSEFQLLTIPNSNHHINAELVFDGTCEDAVFRDLHFGGVWYELFEFSDEQPRAELLSEIQQIMNGTVYVIFASNTKTGKRQFANLYDDSPDENLNTMDDFHRTMERINKPKSWWQKLTGRSTTYEIYSWFNYKRIIK